MEGNSTLTKPNSNIRLSNEQLREAEYFTLASLRVEGLEKERDAWRTVFLEDHDNKARVTEATRLYTKQIEEALNQPLSMVIRKAQFTDLNDSVIFDRDPGKRAMERMRDDNATGKSLHEKAKSSVHGISLAGYIPIDQTFGKAGDDGRASRFNDIVAKRFADQREDIEILNQILEVKNSTGNLTQEQNRQLEKILSENPVTKLPLIDAQGREIYGFRQGAEKPVFAYKNSKGVFINEETGQEVIPPQGKQFEQIEVLSYITGIERGDNGKFQLRTQKITGDHDQLAIGTRIERGSTLQDKALSSDKGFADDVGHAVTVALIDETKASGAIRHGQDAGGSGTKGSLSIKELDAITTSVSNSSDLSSFLENPEVLEITTHKLGGNPYPENFSSGNYAVYTPRGQILVAHNEQEIVDKYNQLEQKGYNIGINPRYCWMRNENNQLQIDPDKISAQSFLIEKVNLEKHPKTNNLSPEVRQNIGQDAEKLYKMHSILSLVKLQKNSPEKQQALAACQKNLEKSEDIFAAKYGVIPPTVSAMVNPERKAPRNEALSKIITNAEQNSELHKKSSLTRRNTAPARIETSAPLEPASKTHTKIHSTQHQSNTKRTSLSNRSNSPDNLKYEAPPSFKGTQQKKQSYQRTQ